MEKKDKVTLVCPNKHYTSFSRTSRMAIELREKKVKYDEILCPECRAPYRAVVCSSCRKCVSPFSPCCKCGDDPLVVAATCSSPVC